MAVSFFWRSCPGVPPHARCPLSSLRCSPLHDEKPALFQIMTVPSHDCHCFLCTDDCLKRPMPMDGDKNLSLPLSCFPTSTFGERILFLASCSPCSPLPYLIWAAMEDGIYKRLPANMNRNALVIHGNKFKSDIFTLTLRFSLLFSGLVCSDGQSSSAGIPGRALACLGWLVKGDLCTKLCSDVSPPPGCGESMASVFSQFLC